MSRRSCASLFQLVPLVAGVGGILIEAPRRGYLSGRNWSAADDLMLSLFYSWYLLLLGRLQSGVLLRCCWVAIPENLDYFIFGRRPWFTRYYLKVGLKYWLNWEKTEKLYYVTLNFVSKLCFTFWLVYFGIGVCRFPCFSPKCGDACKAIFLLF